MYSEQSPSRGVFLPKLRLRSPQPLESEYRASHGRTARRIIRLSLVVALFTTVGFAIIDRTELLHASRAPDFVRFGLQMPLLLICLL